MNRQLPGGKPRLITPYRIGVSVLLAGAFAALYVAFISAKEPEPELVARPSSVLSFAPVEGATALRQSRIVAELKPGLTGVLYVDGIRIPEDQVEHLEGSNWLGYTPGPGTETGPLKPGRRCATVEFWSLETGPATSDTFAWCWTVH